MKLLPSWKIPDTRPAVYDVESATCIEMVAKLYGAMNEIIEECNTFITTTEAKIDEYIKGSEEDIDLFKVGLRQEFQDFIDVIELKIQAQDLKIEEAEKYMETNIERTATNVINQKIREGDITFETIYDPDSESLTLITTTK
jgi:hypothetical protein